jgi:hypothetical protein
MRPTGEQRLELYGGLVNRFGEDREGGSSVRVLSMVVWVGQRGMEAVVRTRGHRRRLAGRRGSGRQWGPCGGATGVGGGWRLRPSVRRPRRKWCTAWGGFGDSSQQPAQGKSAA